MTRSDTSRMASPGPVEGFYSYGRGYFQDKDAAHQRLHNRVIVAGTIVMALAACCVLTVVCWR